MNLVLWFFQNRVLTIEIGQSGVAAIEGVHLPVRAPAMEAAVGARAAVRVPPAGEGSAGVVVHFAHADAAAITTSSRRLAAPRPLEASCGRDGGPS